ncbi:MAG: RNA 2',3'-cyclic phosphodiesterase [Myxococcota bacterium]|nr:RNA 2',3'-cyclic phosphodiesterase [Myxococcota bacterium]
MLTIRCFLAVKLDLDTVRGVAEAQVGLRDACRDLGMRVAWVPPPNMHVTLRFLGQVTEPMAYALKEMLEPAVRGVAPFELSSVGLGAFPSPLHPKTIWAGTGVGTTQLCELADGVTTRLMEAGFRFSDQTFRSHITIGRVKEGGGEAFAKHLSGSSEELYGSSIVRNIYCYRSDLKPSGAEYHALWRLPFGKEWHPPDTDIAQNHINEDYQFDDADEGIDDEGGNEDLGADSSDRDPEGSEAT